MSTSPPTVKSPSASSKSRNRANQAASRARTKARITALEAQAADFRARGVAATAEVQRAARAVAAENVRLRELLAGLGVGEEQIAKFLDMDVMPVLAPDRCRAKCCDDETVGRTPGEDGAAVHHGTGRDDGRRSSGINSNSSDKRSGEERGGPEMGAGDTAAPDETACEDAAMIIASMRGGGRPEDVWPELGCGASRACAVKNSKIFDLAEPRLDRIEFS